MLIIWFSQHGFLMIDLVIEYENHVVAHKRAFNTGNDQFIHTEPIESNNLRVTIIDLLDIDALLPISHDEMTTSMMLLAVSCRGQRNL